MDTLVPARVDATVRSEPRTRCRARDTPKSLAVPGLESTASVAGQADPYTCALGRSVTTPEVSAGESGGRGEDHGREPVSFGWGVGAQEIFADSLSVPRRPNANSPAYPCLPGSASCRPGWKSRAETLAAGLPTVVSAANDVRSEQPL